jgi:hypothetical protein
MRADRGRRCGGTLGVARQGGPRSQSFYLNAKRAVHVAESVADTRGAIVFPRWGPKARTEGMMDEGAPQVLVFKAGYQPLVRDRYKANEPLRLRRSDAPVEDYVKSIIAFEEQGLYWRTTEDWPAFPRMVMALHREKARLGEDGQRIPGVNLMADRSKDFRLSGGFGEYQEAFVVRSDGKAGSVTFVNSGGTWRIDEM